MKGWHFCGLINFLQLCTLVTFIVLQFIVAISVALLSLIRFSFTVDNGCKNEKSFLQCCASLSLTAFIHLLTEKLFITTNDFAVLSRTHTHTLSFSLTTCYVYLLESTGELFSFQLCFSALFHSSPSVFIFPYSIYMLLHD